MTRREIREKVPPDGHAPGNCGGASKNSLVKILRKNLVPRPKKPGKRARSPPRPVTKSAKKKFGFFFLLSADRPTGRPTGRQLSGWSPCSAVRGNYPGNLHGAGKLSWESLRCGETNLGISAVRGNYCGNICGAGKLTWESPRCGETIVGISAVRGN